MRHFEAVKVAPLPLDICLTQSMRRALLKLIIVINRTTLEIAINCHLHAFQRSFQLLMVSQQFIINAMKPHPKQFRIIT